MSWSWLVIIASAAVIIVLTLPVYTIILAIITIIRAKWRHRDNHSSNDTFSKAPIVAASAPSPWSHIRTSFFQGTVFHIRHRPVIHAFRYPLYFAVVELEEASELFGPENVQPATHPSSSSVEDHQKRHHSQEQRLHANNNISEPRGTLWPLSSLMLLRDIDHLKNGEGRLGHTGTCTSSTTPSSPTLSSTETTKSIVQNASMRERICNLVHERTNGKLDLRISSTRNNNNNNDDETNDEGERRRRRRRRSRSEESYQRKIILVTHLMYYGYCFNPVSLFFILKSTKVKKEDGEVNYEKETKEEEEEEEEGPDEIEAIVVEVSNTPWNEMSIYVLHPDSVDTLEYTIYPPRSPSLSASSMTTTTTTTKFDAPTHRYRWRKNFHVSPFMTMDFDYDWKFQVSCDRIKVEAIMIRRPAEDDGGEVLDGHNEEEAIDEKKTNVGQLFFTAGFDIQRTIVHPPTLWYPLQLALIILRFPIYCFIIQLWIHYEAFKLLMKGVQFIPHPQGSETGASRAIAAVMRPIFGAMEVVDAWWSRWKSWCSGYEGKLKDN